jgi:uncharacterized protein (TIGR03032 family)
MTAPEKPPSPPDAPDSPALQSAAERLPHKARGVVDVRCSPSPELGPLLERLEASVVVTAPHSGNLIVVAAPQGKTVLSFHTFERAMGVAVTPDVLAVCTHTEVWFLRNAPDIAAKLEPRGRFDACYLTRACHFTGDVQGHEAVRVGGELCLVNTLFSCLCTLHPRYSFAPRWRPPFVSALAPEDRCHLNGVALVDGRPGYVTAVAETDTRQGWRPARASGGCVIDVANGRTVVRGLCMPHSPRFSNGRLYLLDSGTGRLVSADVASGRVETVAELPGFTRGLAIHGSLAFVGLSRIRSSSDMSGLPIAARADRLQCGLAVVDLNNGQTMAHLEVASPVDEVFDVQMLPGVRCPFLSGPYVDHEQGQPLWTIPPATIPSATIPPTGAAPG